MSEVSREDRKSESLEEVNGELSIVKDAYDEKQEDRKSESLEEVNGELSTVRDVYEEIQEEGKFATLEEINKSEIPTSEIKEMEVHHHPEVEKRGLKNICSKV